MIVVTANDLKTKGISDIERALQDAQEAVISVRGKPRYVVMDIAHYDYLRECEIAAPGRRRAKTSPRDATGARGPMRTWRASKTSSPMSYNLIFTESYEKTEKRFLKRHPDLLDSSRPDSIIQTSPLDFHASPRNQQPPG